MGQTDAWPAPAKLNLMLRIVGRRPDGYHELQTVFQLLDYQDLLYFSLRPDGRIIIDSSLEGISQEQNLIHRAARALQAFTRTEQGAEITLIKHIPMGGGLGGGSSDAATTLLALNQLWNTGLTAAQLADLGISLGADVPIFLYGHSAWAEGVGERLQALDLPESWYLVLTPDCHISTAEIFASPDLTRNSPRITIRDFLQGETSNDCQALVRRSHPEVAEALDWLVNHSDARMTGTGACVFAAFPNAASADAAHRQLPAGLRGFVAKGLNRSPLLDRLENE